MTPEDGYWGVTHQDASLDLALPPTIHLHHRGVAPFHFVFYQIQNLHADVAPLVIVPQSVIYSLSEGIGQRDMCQD